MGLRKISSKENKFARKNLVKCVREGSHARVQLRADFAERKIVVSVASGMKNKNSKTKKFKFKR